MNITILGGGLSALTSILILRKHFSEKNFTDYHFDVYTKGSGIGEDSFLDTKVFETDLGLFKFDLGGHYFHYKNYPQLFDLLPDFEEKSNFIKKTAKVYIENSYHLAPLQEHLDDLPPHISERIKNELKELEGKDFSNSTTLGEMFHKYGDYLYHYFFSPYNTKMYGGLNPDYIPVGPTEKKFNTVSKALNYNSDFLYPKVGGIKTLINELKKKLEETEDYTIHPFVDVRDSADLDQIIIPQIRESKTNRTNNIIINTLNLNTLLDVLKKHDKNWNKYHFNFSTGLIYNIGIKGIPDVNANWVYYPSSGTPIYRVGNYTKASKDMSPEGCSSLYVEVTTDRAYSNLNENFIINDLIHLGWLKSAEDIKVWDRIDIPCNYSFYSPDLPTVQEKLENLKIYNVGRWAKWRWPSSMHNSFLEAEEVSNLILKEL